MIIDKIMSKFNTVMHNNAVHKKKREWNIFRPYKYRGTVSRILKIADYQSQTTSMRYINGKLQRTTKPIQTTKRSRSRQKNI
jgi:hypothetical protein